MADGDVPHLGPKICTQDIKTIFYTGSSMWPILRDQDRLHFASYIDLGIEPGDVVVISAPTGKRVVHRVTSSDDHGIRTQGDNTIEPDPWILQCYQVEGKVIFAERKGKRIPIYGGIRGKVCAVPARINRYILHNLGKLLKPIYKCLMRLERPGTVLPALKILALYRTEGIELQLLMAGRIIGRKKAGDVWKIKPPFRIFVKESFLKNASEKASNLHK